MTRIWKLKPLSPLAPKLFLEASLPVLLSQLLINRGITESRGAQAFLSPRLAHLAHPMELKDMDQGVDVILRAIENREKITIYGDYDADGLTATALLMHFFSQLDIPVSYCIPNRLVEGYGLNQKALHKMAGEGTGLVITVDCGISNIQEIALAKNLGIKVVVTDHHQIPEDFAPLCPMINPHRSDSSFPFKHLAGVGVAFFLAIAVRAALRERGWFRGRSEPDLRKYLDLVALGTVADMVPLQDQNRILVSAGLERMKNTSWPGLDAIVETASVAPGMITPHDIAFRIAPRLNASGRMGSAEMCVVALTTDRPNIAKGLAHRLEAMNSQRQSVERLIVEHIEGEVSSKGLPEDQRTLVFWGDDWHRGVLGIVASKLVEKYHRPVFVLSVRNGVAFGSGRSIPGFDLYEALHRLSHLLKRFGGHKHAAGLALEASCMKDFSAELERLAKDRLGPEDLISTVEIDAETSLQEMTLETLGHLNTLAPFGPGNPEPLLLARSVQVVESRIVRDKHLKMKVKQDGAVAEAIGFGLSENHPLQEKTLNLVFTPEIDRWQGCEKVQLKLIDLELADGPSKLR
jgi:single-stranded-DNA-specific exonuclease